MQRLGWRFSLLRFAVLRQTVQMGRSSNVLSRIEKAEVDALILSTAPVDSASIRFGVLEKVLAKFGHTKDT